MINPAESRHGRHDAGRDRDRYVEITRALRPVLAVVATANLTPRQYRVFNAVLAFTIAWSKLEDAVSLAQIEEFTGLDRRHVRRALQQLHRLGVITYEPGASPKGKPRTTSRIGLPRPGADMIPRSPGADAVPLSSLTGGRSGPRPGAESGQEPGDGPGPPPEGLSEEGSEGGHAAAEQGLLGQVLAHPDVTPGLADGYVWWNGQQETVEDVAHALGIRDEQVA